MNLQTLFLRLPAMLIALTVHEYMHAFVAYVRGDSTARDAGRLTLNPMPHIDPLGLAMILWGPFGWARPVPVNFANLKRPRLDMILVSAAGPVANFAMAFLAGGCISLISRAWQSGFTASYFVLFLKELFLINAILPVFNLIPVPPLDGSKILMGVLPRSALMLYFKISKYVSIFFILALLSDWFYSEFRIGMPVFSRVFWPLLLPYLHFWQLLFGVSII
jgi:Zn-dependent protease